MSLISAISEFATASSYTVTRTASGTLSNGVFTAGSTSTFTIVASVQPVGRDLQNIPEGKTASDVRTIYTTTRLQVTPSGPDSIAIDGEAYQVYDVSQWTMDGDTHYVCLAARQTIPGAG